MYQFSRPTSLGEGSRQDHREWHRPINGMVTGADSSQRTMMKNQTALRPLLLQHVPAQPHQLPLMDWQVPASLPAEPLQFLSTHLTPPLGPQLNSMPPTDNTGSEHSFLCSKPVPIGRQLEVIHRKNVARLELNAILQHKELLNSQHGNPIMHQGPGMPLNAVPFWVAHHGPECHPPSDVIIHCTPQGVQPASRLLRSPKPYPPLSTQQRLRGRDEGTRLANRRNFDSGSSQWEDREWTVGLGEQQGGEHSETGFRNGRRNGTEGGSGQQDDDWSGGATPSGVMEEELRKWTVEDVCSFIQDIPGCSEYAEVFRDQAIDGQALPLLTDRHLLETLGLKLGPALKIRAQVCWITAGSRALQVCPLVANSGSAPTPESPSAARPARATPSS